MMIGQDDHTESQVNVLRESAQGAKDYFRARRHRKTRQEVVFHEPDRIKSHLIGQDALFERLFDYSMVVDDWLLHLICQAESHASLPSKLKKHRRAAPTGMAYCRKAGGRTQRLPHEHSDPVRYDCQTVSQGNTSDHGVHFANRLPSGAQI